MNNKNNESQDCCQKIEQKESKGFLSGLIYGIVPHIGCIAFILASIFGVTAATELFKPLLMNPYFFYILILLSFSFATISSVLYLRKNGMLSSSGMKRKWKYLSTMYGSTIGVNLLFFMIIFPLLANISTSSQPITANSLGLVNSLSLIQLQVDIPCSGHASLITDEMKKIDGVSGVQFSLPNVFNVTYDNSKTSKQQILELEVFKTYKATVLSESSNQQVLALDQQATLAQQTVSGSCCGGGESCSGCGVCECGGR